MSAKSSLSSKAANSARKSKHRPQHLARQRALQALYQQQINPQASSEIIAQFLAMQDFSNVDEGYFQALVKTADQQREQIIKDLSDYLDIKWDNLDAIECVILSIGWVELTDQLQMPVKVVINEAIEMAKRYGAEKSHGFINGVLDKYAQKVRALEIEMLEQQAGTGN